MQNKSKWRSHAAVLSSKTALSVKKGSALYYNETWLVQYNKGPHNFQTA